MGIGNFSNVKVGGTQVQKIMLGSSQLWVYDATAPTTTANPVGGTYEGSRSVTLTANEPSTIYYTTNGTTPTTSSPKYTGAITISNDTTLKYFAVDANGNVESVKTQTYNILLGWRYVRYIGYGDHTSMATTRLVELEAIDGTTNYLRSKVPISGETPNAGASVSAATDGSKSMSSGTYPIWWTGAGIPTLTYDLGANRFLDTMSVTMFSTVNDPRQTRFKIYVGRTTSSWTLVKDYSSNTTAQPTTGFSFSVPKE